MTIVFRFFGQLDLTVLVNTRGVGTSLKDEESSRWKPVGPFGLGEWTTPKGSTYNRIEICEGFELWQYAGFQGRFLAEDLIPFREPGRELNLSWGRFETISVSGTYGEFQGINAYRDYIKRKSSWRRLYIPVAERLGIPLGQRGKYADEEWIRRHGKK